MQPKSIIISIFLQFILSPLLFGQNKYITYNLKQLDSVDIISRQQCTECKSTFKFSKKKVNYDKKRIKFLNKFYQKDLKLDEIITLLKSNFTKWHIDTINLGAATKYKLKMYDVDYGNLRLQISFASLENEIIFKRFELSTQSKLYCNVPTELFLIETLDAKYLEKYAIPLIEFPIKYKVNSLRVTADTTYHNKLYKTTSSTYYSFQIDSIKNLSQMTWFDNDVYQYNYAYFKDTSAQVDTEMLFHFLYSPNHIIAIDAYESLIFLSNAKQMTLPATIVEKMDDIKNSDIKIVCQTSDVIRRGLTYKDLKISKYQMISKFRKKPTSGF